MDAAALLEIDELTREFNRAEAAGTLFDPPAPPEPVVELVEPAVPNDQCKSYLRLEKLCLHHAGMYTMRYD